MHLRNPLVFRLMAGLVAVFALAMVVFVIGNNSDSPSASAVGPVPTKIANDGPLGGVVDILVTAGPLPTDLGLFYCIGKNDHEINGVVEDLLPDPVKVAVQCNATVPGFGDADPVLVPPTVCDVAGDQAGCNPSELEAFPVSGPPPPPPYGVGKPMKGYGFYYDNGIDPNGLCNAPSFPDMPPVDEATFIGNLPAGSPCSVVITCFEDLGAPTGTGPNLVATAVTYRDAAVAPAGAVLGYTLNQSNQNNATCKAAASGDPNVVNFSPGGRLPLYLQTWQVTDKAGAPTGVAAPYRPGGVNNVNWDGDECTDLQELDKTMATKCGDDPQNPSDSYAVGTDLSGTYGILVRGRAGEGITGLEFARADCIDDTTDVTCLATAVPGTYFFCRADLQHDTGTNDVVVRAYCYTDSALSEVNKEGYPGVTGDGFAGGPPPGPELVPGNGNFAYGDVDSEHTVLSGIYNKATNNFELSGCFKDLDGQGSIGNAYVVATVPAHQLAIELGTVDIWPTQLEADCIAGNPVDGVDGVPSAITNMPWTFDIGVWQSNPSKGKNYDQDGDGLPTSFELQNNSVCGLRDPYNGWDYYDVSVPRDGVIDLFNDIVGVINNYDPDGLNAGNPALSGAGNQINYDRPSKITASAGNWNRGSPDGVVDLFNDISGVIGQYNPDGTNAAAC